uniref:Uncharacterized protein n=1 Tax=Eutreptiella gymnastica TaxID=73025 RepID=A0A7S4CU52_9EUGL
MAHVGTNFDGSDDRREAVTDGGNGEEERTLRRMGGSRVEESSSILGDKHFFAGELFDASLNVLDLILKFLPPFLNGDRVETHRKSVQGVLTFLLSTFKRPNGFFFVLLRH